MTQPAAKRVGLDEFLALPEDARLQLIGGQIVPREATTFAHGDAQTGLATWTGTYFKRKPEGTIGGWWIITEAEVAYETGECYHHDIAGWRRDRLVEKPSGRPVRSFPDWVCEVVSPSNWRTDTVVKFETCFRYKVGHYWIVDVEHRILTVYNWHPEGWLRLMTAEPGQRARLEPFEAVEFEVAVLFGDDPGPEPARVIR